MSFKRLSVTELMAIVGGLLLAFGLFQDWYELANRRVEVNGLSGPDVLSGWQSLAIVRYLLLLAAIAPIVLAYIIIRGHKLSWARGELTAVLAMAALCLILYKGIVEVPGEPASLVSLQYGWFIALAGVVLMLVGSALRASTTERPRKPPGVL